MLDTEECLRRLNRGEYVEGGSEVHQWMHRASQEAIRITMELNSAYHPPEEIRALFARLTDHGPPACEGERYSFAAVYGAPAPLGIMDGLGMEEEDVLYSLAEYEQRNAEVLAEHGEGEYQAYYLIYGREAVESIRRTVETRGYENGFLREAVSSLGLADYSFSIYINVRELSGGWYLLAQTTQLYG